MIKRFRWFDGKIAVSCMAGLLSGCYTLAGLDMSFEGRHKMWVEHMASQIGKVNMHVYRQRGGFIGDRVLPNGNLEAGFGLYYPEPKCRYYYEYEPKTGAIVGFRFEESERFACRITGA